MANALDPHSPAVDALVALYLERRCDLVRFFTARTGSAGEAEDVVQDIYLKLQRLDGAAEIGNGMAYLYRLGANVMLDRLRGARRAIVRDDAWRQAHHVAVGSEDAADLPEADRAVDARLRLERLIAALDHLPPQTRRVFRLHKLDGLSQGAVAEALGISRSAVEKHVATAVKRLAEGGA